MHKQWLTIALFFGKKCLLANFWGFPGSPEPSRDDPANSQKCSFLSFMIFSGWKRGWTPSARHQEGRGGLPGVLRIRFWIDFWTSFACELVGPQSLLRGKTIDARLLSLEHLSYHRSPNFTLDFKHHCQNERQTSTLRTVPHELIMERTMTNNLEVMVHVMRGRTHFQKKLKRSNLQKKTYVL